MSPTHQGAIWFYEAPSVRLSDLQSQNGGMTITGIMRPALKPGILAARPGKV